MDYARDLHSGKVVAADDASPERSYACPRPGCGGRVYLPDVVIQRPHFRHYPNEGAPECDEYFPGMGAAETVASALASVEENPVELGLVLTQLDGRWGIGLRLPEIPNEELGETSLTALGPALVDVYVGTDRVLRVGALELRPGIGAARVEVPPTLQAFRTQPAGSWPTTIDSERWSRECRGLHATGVLFRLRRGEWTRLVQGAGAYFGETLLVLAEARCDPTALSQPTHLASVGSQWGLWEVQLPSEPQEAVTAWLSLLGHELVPRPWAMELAMPPRAHGEGGDPIFWVSDFPVIALEAPQLGDEATVSFQSGTNLVSNSVEASQSRVTYLGVNSQDTGLARLAINGERDAFLDIEFSQEPSRAAVLDELARTSRLRVQIGQQTFNAWQGHEFSVRVPLHAPLDVSADLGFDSARARVTVWEHGKARSRRGLDSRGVARAILDSLASASRIEVDVDNLGRIAILPVLASRVVTHQAKTQDRLAWRDESLNCSPSVASPDVPTLVEGPRSRSLVVRRVGAAALVRSRLALRRRLETRGARK